MHDLKQTNKAVADAMDFKEHGITLRKVPENKLCFVAFHDAALGNTTPEEIAANDEQWLGDHQLASQLGSLVLLADTECLSTRGGYFSLRDRLEEQSVAKGAVSTTKSIERLFHENQPRNGWR